MNIFSSFFIILMVFEFPEILSIGVEEFYPDERDDLIRFRDSVNSTLDLHSIWTGPPCYRNQSKWVGIDCSNWHVINLVLEGVELTGSLPPKFLQNLKFLTKLSFRNNSLFGPLPDLGTLISLKFIMLSNNNFSGSIPIDYIDLPNLVQLELQDNSLTGKLPPFYKKTLTIFNVSSNFLEGKIPETQILENFSEKSFENNPGLCGKPLKIQCFNPPEPVLPPFPYNPSKKSKSLEVWSVALIAVAATLVPFTVMLVFLCYYRKKMTGKGQDDEDSDAMQEGKKEKKDHSSRNIADPERIIELEFFSKERLSFDLDDLLRSSAEFMGKGQLGGTYKATLETGMVVTVKRLSEMNGLSKKEFVQQLQLLGKMKHENLVEIISFYYSKEEKLVINEYVLNGSLFELLHGNREQWRIPVNWSTRLSIVKGIATGLAFLHQSLPSHKLPHGNLKSSNVLLAQHNHPKLTDFGLHPLLTSRKTAEKLAAGKSPEFRQGKKLTHKADIYCFGILLLEVITGRIPGQFSPENDDPVDGDLSDWVRFAVNQDWTTDILDLEILAAKSEHGQMLRLTEIALECTDPMPEKRPKMSDLLKRIEDIREEGEGSGGERETDCSSGN